MLIRFLSLYFCELVSECQTFYIVIVMLPSQEFGINSLSPCHVCNHSNHLCSCCPASDAVCKIGGKTRHFKQVCKQKPIPSSSCLNSCFTSPVSKYYWLPFKLYRTVNDRRHRELRQLRFTIYPRLLSLGMSSVQLAKIGGIYFYVLLNSKHCVTSIRCQNVSHENVKRSVTSNLCSNVLPSHRFLKLHQKV